MYYAFGKYSNLLYDPFLMGDILTQGRTLALDLSLVVGIEPIAGTFTKRYMLILIAKGY